MPCKKKKWRGKNKNKQTKNIKKSRLDCKLVKVMYRLVNGMPILAYDLGNEQTSLTGPFSLWSLTLPEQTICRDLWAEGLPKVRLEVQVCILGADLRSLLPDDTSAGGWSRCGGWETGLACCCFSRVCGCVVPSAAKQSHLYQEEVNVYKQTGGGERKHLFVCYLYKELVFSLPFYMTFAVSTLAL